MIHEVDSRLLKPKFLLEYISAFFERQSHIQHRQVLQSITPSQVKTLIENRDELSRINPRLFEELVAELLKVDGNTVQLVNRHNAPGPDIIAHCQAPTGQKLEFLVECKRWSKSVGIEVVRSLMYRVDQEFRSTGGILVTTSDITRPARDLAERFHKWRLQLVDAEKLQEWIKRCACYSEDIKINHSMVNDEIISILKRPNGHGPVLRPAVGPPCQQCGSDIVCGYIDLGLHDYYDNYFHVCTGCLDNAHTEKFSQNGYEGESVCPFCKRLWEGIGANPNDYLSLLVSRA